MRHALAVMIVAGIAGGAAWYKMDPPRRATSKVQVPDLGASDDLADSEPPEWQPLDIDLMAPVEKLPSQLIAEYEPQIQTVSDEQVFATSDEPTETPAEKTVPVRPSSSRRDDPFEPETKAAKPDLDEANDNEAQSVEGRPIDVRKFGQGPYRTLIIAGLDGRDRTAVAWCDELTAALEARKDLLEQQEFVLIRLANPDGLAAKKRENARGVDLNRNFPTRRYRPNVGQATGVGPASEPETRALLQTMYDFRPQRVVHVCSTSAQSLIVANQQSGDVAARMQRQFGLPVERMNPDRLPGSVEELADATWNSSVLMLQLHGVPEPEISEKIMPILISAASVRDTRAATVAPVSTPRKQTSRWSTSPNSSPVPTRQVEPRQRPVLRRGYEELSPPPQ